MSNLYQRMTETLATNMGDTLTVNRQFEEAVSCIAELEIENGKLLDALKWIRGLAGTLDVAVSIADKTLKDSKPLTEEL